VKVIGVSVMCSQNWDQNHDLINAIRKTRPDAVIVVGGEHVTALPELTVPDCPAIDVAVTGEGELSLLELVHRAAMGQSYDDMVGLCFMRDGQFIDNGFGKRVADFENLSRPA